MNWQLVKEDNRQTRVRHETSFASVTPAGYLHINQQVLAMIGTPHAVQIQHCPEKNALKLMTAISDYRYETNGKAVMMPIIDLVKSYPELIGTKTIHKVDEYSLILKQE